MKNNIIDEDLKSIICFLSQPSQPILTHSEKVIEFERKWSEWLGVKYSVFVNSGSSANVISMMIIGLLSKSKNVIVPPLTWASDISSVIHAKLEPVFCDINLHTLAIDENELEKLATEDIGAVFLTHVLGYNGLTQKILDICKKNNILLVEDACESHGARFKEKKVGSFGAMSNFSFYYAHHMTSIEGGMICTNNEKIYQLARMFRSHGLLRECTNSENVSRIKKHNKDLNESFIFMYPAYNMRPTEINAVLALQQLKRLDLNNQYRSRNLLLFLNSLDNKKYFTEFNTNGNSNYAFTLLLRKTDLEKRNLIEKMLRNNNIEFRRGMSGGGNQLRQPYLKRIYNNQYKNYPNADHVHHFGWYIGNYPELQEKQILYLTSLLNKI